MSSAFTASASADAPDVKTLAVLVSAGVTPYVARTLRAIARQSVIPDVLLVVDVASRINGLGDGTPVAEAVTDSGVDQVTAVRIVHVPEATGFGDAVSHGLERYASLVVAGNRRRSDKKGARTLSTLATGTHRTAAGQLMGPTGALSPITASERRQVATAEGSRQDSPVAPGQVWLWLLHDDSAPDPGCLEALLEAVVSARSVGVAGPKQVDWDDADRLLEVGLRTTASARRANDIIDGEIDQGQHDDRSDVLAVGTAGALVDRAVWDQVGGTSPLFPVFGDGLEFSRAARLAGFRVVVVPQAVIRHRRASYLGLRTTHPHARMGARSAARQPRPDPDRSFRARRAAQLTAWATFSTRPLPLLLAWFLLTGVLRAAARFLTKAPGLAADELSAALTVLGRSRRIREGRARLAAHQEVRRSVLSRLYVDPAEIRAVRRDRRRQERERAARAAAPSELEQQELAALARRRRRVLAATLLMVTAVALLALSPVLVTRSLTGGALVGLSGSWRETWDAAWTTWAASGDGYAAAPAPLLAVLAVPMALVSVLGLGGDELVRILLVIALPLAALGAWFAAGTLTRRTVLRAWATIAWAFAPSLLLGVGQGRLAAVLVHLALPWALTALARAVGVDRRDLVLSGLVGAHHATAEEKEELDRFASSKMSDLANLDDENAEGDGTVEGDQTAEGDRTAENAEGAAGSKRNGTDDAVDVGRAPDSQAAGSDPADGEPGDDAARDDAAVPPGPRAVALAKIVEDNDAEFGPAPERRTRRARRAAERSAESDRNAESAQSAETAGPEAEDAPADSAGQEADEGPSTDLPEAEAGSDAGEEDLRLAAMEKYGPGSPTAAAVAGLFLVVVVAAAPVTAAILVPGLIVLAAVKPRSALRLLLTLLPVVATAWPSWSRALDLLGSHGKGEALRYLLTDAGAPVANASPSAAEILLGVPVDIESISTDPFLALLAKVLLAFLPAVAVLGLLTTGRRGHLARAGLLLALAGMGLAGLSTRVITATGTWPDSTGSVTVTAWAGTGISLALAGLLMAGLAAGDAAYGRLARHAFGWRHVSVAVVCVLVVLIPVTVGGAWAVAAQRSSLTGSDAVVMALRGASQQVPVIAAEMQTSPAAGRVLVLTSTDGGLVVRIWRGPGTQVGDVRPDVIATQFRERTTEPATITLASTASQEVLPVSTELLDPADAELADLVARATAGQDESVADGLAAHGVAVVLLSDLPGDDLTATVRSGLGATPGLEQLAQTDTGTSWRVAPSQATESARAVLVGSDGTTVLPVGPAMVGVDVPAAEGTRTLVLAERADPDWQATLDGQPLTATTVAGPAGQWRQAFEVPEQGGELVVTHRTSADTVAVHLMWAAWALAALAALPLRRGRSG